MNIDHIQIAIPIEGEIIARAFYTDLLGLIEIPKPAELVARGGCWFQAENMQLHLGVDPVFHPAKKAHVALRVNQLDELRTKIEAAGYETVADSIINGRKRFFSHDPFGNRIEFIDEFC